MVAVKSLKAYFKIYVLVAVLLLAVYALISRNWYESHAIVIRKSAVRRTLIAHQQASVNRKISFLAPERNLRINMMQKSETHENHTAAKKSSVATRNVSIKILATEATSSGMGSGRTRISRNVTSLACNDADKLQLIITVHTAIDNRETRDAIRQSWGSKANLRKYNASLYFLIGQPETPSASKAQSIKSEQDMYGGDLVQFDFIDTYMNFNT